MAQNYTLDQLREQAAERDVSFNVKRLYGSRVRAADPEVLEILKTGHISEAVRWLVSTTPEEMKYGTGSKELRIANAISHAALAGASIEAIAEERGLSHLLLADVAE